MLSWISFNQHKQLGRKEVQTLTTIYSFLKSARFEQFNHHLCVLCKLYLRNCNRKSVSIFNATHFDAIKMYWKKQKIHCRSQWGKIKKKIVMSTVEKWLEDLLSPKCAAHIYTRKATVQSHKTPVHWLFCWSNINGLRRAYKKIDFHPLSLYIWISSTLWIGSLHSSTMDLWIFPKHLVFLEWNALIFV